MKKILCLLPLLAVSCRAETVTNFVHVFDTNGQIIYTGEVLSERSSSADLVGIWLAALSGTMGAGGIWLYVRKARETVNAAGGD